MVFSLHFQKIKDLPVTSKNTKMPSQFQQAIAKLLWLISTARNIIIVIICAVMAWALEIRLGESPVILTGHVKQGLPEFRLPSFETRVGNETYTFLDMISSLGSGCLVVPMLSLLETISIAKVFCKKIPSYIQQIFTMSENKFLLWNIHLTVKTKFLTVSRNRSTKLITTQIEDWCQARCIIDVNNALMTFLTSIIHP